jgi:hypothetical protein
MRVSEERQAFGVERSRINPAMQDSMHQLFDPRALQSQLVRVSNSGTCQSVRAKNCLNSRDEALKTGAKFLMAQAGFEPATLGL